MWIRQRHGILMPSISFWRGKFFFSSFFCHIEIDLSSLRSICFEISHHISWTRAYKMCCGHESKVLHFHLTQIIMKKFSFLLRFFFIIRLFLIWVLCRFHDKNFIHFTRNDNLSACYSAICWPFWLFTLPFGTMTRWLHIIAFRTFSTEETVTFVMPSKRLRMPHYRAIKRKCLLKHKHWQPKSISTK